MLSPSSSGSGARTRSSAFLRWKQPRLSDASTSSMGELAAEKQQGENFLTCESPGRGNAGDQETGHRGQRRVDGALRGRSRAAADVRASHLLEAAQSVQGPLAILTHAGAARGVAVFLRVLSLDRKHTLLAVMRPLRASSCRVLCCRTTISSSLRGGVGAAGPSSPFMASGLSKAS
ncbi:hypothetical protein EYF80_047682 [Liparis tanakae]|uniref:Uncharacterized protein n=1 Tax=Liparis tanakae TaxID=230148 RepID=A0A4Z2FLV0_9TELE|nr:hypothetical protein EYF80_047682 [Liparis tanakae]